MNARLAHGRRTVSGIVLLDKPAGLSSNAALQRVKRLYDAAKAGHTGSLDPLASGMLPICLGEATKIAGALLDARKQYRFTIHLGERTASGDAEHEVIERRAVPQLDLPGIESALRTLAGTRSQVPPMHSAVKHEGQRLYQLARRGVEVERKPRVIEISELRVLEWAVPRLTLAVTCSKGTYVRVLAEEIAAALGTVGYVVDLRRVWTAPFEADAMVTLPELESGDQAALARWLLPVDHPLGGYPRVDLDVEQARRIGHGQVIALETWALAAGELPATEVRLYAPGSRFIGVGVVAANGRLQPKRLMDLGL